MAAKPTATTGVTTKNIYYAQKTKKRKERKIKFHYTHIEITAVHVYVCVCVREAISALCLFAHLI